jgi:hypothetical protein
LSVARMSPSGLRELGSKSLEIDAVSAVMHEALRRPSGTTLETVHAETGRRSLSGHRV